MSPANHPRDRPAKKSCLYPAGFFCIQVADDPGQNLRITQTSVCGSQAQIHQLGLGVA